LYNRGSYNIRCNRDGVLTGKLNELCLVIIVKLYYNKYPKNCIDKKNISTSINSNIINIFID